MAKYFVDPPSGWLYGFPKVWDSTNDSPVDEWLIEQGYPEEGMVSYVRMWDAPEVKEWK